MIKERLIQVIENKAIPKEFFYKKIGMTSANFRGNAKKTPLNSNAIENILSEIPDLNPEWLLTGNGEMLKNNASYTKNKIPLYNAISIGGNNDIAADVDNGGELVEWIDAGNLFPSATAAIMQFGDSMVEYPSGCILALKRIYNKEEIVNGENYVIETNENRVTKQLQDVDEEYFVAYSTNQERYADGRLVYSPFKIYKSNIRTIHLVLGYVVKSVSSNIKKVK